MPGQGTAILDFGAAPGKSDVALAITGQAGIASGSLCEAWISYTASADHSADEHFIEELRVMAGNVVAGVGFTIYARTERVALLGKFNINWVWN